MSDALPIDCFLYERASFLGMFALDGCIDDRQAVPEDLNFITTHVSAIEQLCFQKCDRMVSVAFELSHGRIHSGILILAVDSNRGQAVGYVLASQRSLYGIVEKIAIVPTYRRCGYGTLLLKHMLRWLQKRVKLVQLSVEVEKEDAQRLYCLIGFQVKCVKEDYYGKGRSALHMEKNL